MIWGVTTRRALFGFRSKLSLVLGVACAVSLVAPACASRESVGTDEPNPGFAPTGDCNGTGTIRGTVFDPSGRTPLYNVFVYVPSAPLEPIEPGLGPTCAACQTMASGAPSAAASTDVKGQFELRDVRPGTNVPVVIQIGKWRRQVIVPEVKACTTVTTDDALTHLPRNRSEGDMPRIAVTTGVDFHECLLHKFGIDEDEFTSPEGEGRIHVFHTPSNQYPFSHGWGESSKLMGNLELMRKYDVIVNSCQGAAVEQDTEGPAYTNMKAYLDGGGRLLASHFQYVWFAPPDSSHRCGQGGCKGPPDLASTADWRISGAGDGRVADIDMRLPKGAALDAWLRNAYAIHRIPPLPEGRFESPLKYGVFVGAARGATSSWVNAEASTKALLLSFNTPVAAAADRQCGRAIYYDGHVSSIADSPDAPTTVFPTNCSPASAHATSTELLLEFFFFDLVTCVGDDTLSPRMPR